MLTGLVLAAVCLGYLPLVEGIADRGHLLSKPWWRLPAVGAGGDQKQEAGRSHVASRIGGCFPSIGGRRAQGRSLAAGGVGRQRSTRSLAWGWTGSCGSPQPADRWNKSPTRWRPARACQAIATAVRVAAMTGGSAVPVFESLAADAADEAALARERRELTVQARLSIAVVAGFPIAVLWLPGHIRTGDGAGPSGSGRRRAARCRCRACSASAWGSWRFS